MLHPLRARRGLRCSLQTRLPPQRTPLLLSGPRELQPPEVPVLAAFPNTPMSPALKPGPSMLSRLLKVKGGAVAPG